MCDPTASCVYKRKARVFVGFFIRLKRSFFLKLQSTKEDFAMFKIDLGMEFFIQFYILLKHQSLRMTWDFCSWFNVLLWRARIRKSIKLYHAEQAIEAIKARKNSLMVVVVVPFCCCSPKHIEPFEDLFL